MHVQVPNIVEVLEKLRCNAQLNKHTHFSAAKRYRRYHIIVGVPAVIISILLSFSFASWGNGHISMIAFDASSNAQIVSWAGALLAFMAAGLSGIQTFFNFQKEHEGNRQVANEYLAIARDCDLYMSQYFDELISLELLAQHIEMLDKRYRKVNRRAERVNVSDADYQRAKRFQDSKQQTQQMLIDRYRESMWVNDGANTPDWLKTERATCEV